MGAAQQAMRYGDTSWALRRAGPIRSDEAGPGAEWQAVDVTPRTYDALTVGLDDLPLASGDVVAGTPTAGIVTLDELFGVEIGVWELSEGTVTDTEVDEISIVLEGRGTVAFADGEVVELRPGVVLRLRAGERTTWTIAEKIRKVWVGP